MQQLTLRNGRLLFSAQLYGDSGAPLVICLHGFPDNSNSFRYQIDDLVEAGYQVLTPALRGFEPSSIVPGNSYNIEDVAQDVFACMDQLQVEKAHLVGHDWGSAIAYFAASSSPQRFWSITTIAVPHPARFGGKAISKVPGQGLKSWYMLFNQIPVLSDYFVRRNDWAYIRFLWRKWSPNQVLSDAEWDDLFATFDKPGVVKAMLEYYRHNVSLPKVLGLKKSAAASEKTAPGEINVPNLAITGADDGCIDTRLFDHAVLAKDHPRGFRIERVENAGHFVHQEKPAVINQLLISWFKQNDAKSAWKA